MKSLAIIIAGAGDVGVHLASLLVQEGHNVVLIDQDQELLTDAAAHLDLITLQGDASSTTVLAEARVESSDMVLAVTTNSSTNLLVCILGKQYGATTTVARVHNPEYFDASQRENFASLGVDHIFSPELLAAQEIKRLLSASGFTDVFDFENGKISVAGITVGVDSELINRSVRAVGAMAGDIPFRCVAILRSGNTIVPEADTRLRLRDHLYFVTTKSQLSETLNQLGQSAPKIDRVMLIGDSALCVRTAQALEDDYRVTLVVKDKELAKKGLEKVKHTMIVKADPSKVDRLMEEGLDRMDAFVALTENSETNIITCLYADQISDIKTIAQVDNIIYTRISQNIGIDTIINKKLIAANNVFRHVRKGQVEAIGSLHGVEAEMIEFVVHKRNRLVKHPLRDLHIPGGAVIAGIIRGEESFIPKGDFRLEYDDRVIVFTTPSCIKQVEEIFK